MTLMKHLVANLLMRDMLFLLLVLSVYYISGTHGKLVKPAKVEELVYNGTDFTLCLVSENNVYFDMLLDEVYLNKKDAEEVISGSKNK